MKFHIYCTIKCQDCKSHSNGYAKSDWLKKNLCMGHQIISRGLNNDKIKFKFASHNHLT